MLCQNGSRPSDVRIQISGTTKASGISAENTYVQSANFWKMSEVALLRATSSRISSTWCVLSTARLKKRQQNFKSRRGVRDTRVIAQPRLRQQASTVVSLVIRGDVALRARTPVSSMLRYRLHRFRLRWVLQRKRRSRRRRRAGIGIRGLRGISLSSTMRTSRCNRRWFTGAKEWGIYSTGGWVSGPLSILFNDGMRCSWNRAKGKTNT